MNPLSRLSQRRSLRHRMEAWRPRLYRLAWSWCHDAELADDLTQETLLRALRRVDQLRDPRRLEQWLSQILANLHRDHLRRQRETVPLEAVELPGGLATDEEAQRLGIVQRVQQAMTQLGDEQRKVITLVDLMGFTYAEVARILDVPAGTVMSRLSRARDRMRRLLETSGTPQATPTLRRVK